MVWIASSTISRTPAATKSPAKVWVSQGAFSASAECGVVSNVKFGGRVNGSVVALTAGAAALAAAGAAVVTAASSAGNTMGTPSGKRTARASVERRWAPGGTLGGPC